jgi:hypothetical protein
MPGTNTSNGAIRFRAASSSVEYHVRYSAAKRTSPTVTIYSSTGASGNMRDLSAGSDVGASSTDLGETGLFATKTTGGTSGNSYAFHFTSSAEL